MTSHLRCFFILFHKKLCRHSVYFLYPSSVLTAYACLYINYHLHIYKNILLLQFYMHLYASVTAGTVCPAAIYAVHKIYNPTNNAVSIKYLHHSSHLLAAIHLFISSHNEIKDFCSMDKKTGRRYVWRMHVYT